MNAIKATFKNGTIVPDGPVPWPEGSRLVVHETRWLTLNS